MSIENESQCILIKSNKLLLRGCWSGVFSKISTNKVIGENKHTSAKQMS